MAALFALAFLIFGCGDDDEPEASASADGRPYRRACGYQPQRRQRAAPAPAATMAPTTAPQTYGSAQGNGRDPPPSPTATPTTPTAVMMPEPVESRLKVAINVPQYGENLEASIHNSIGGFLLPNAESLVGSDHVSQASSTPCCPAAGT